MGIKPSYIKTVGEELLSTYSDRFTNNFDDNKQSVTDVTSVQSKRVRNRIAGFITRKVNTRKRT